MGREKPRIKWENIKDSRSLLCIEATNRKAPPSCSSFEDLEWNGKGGSQENIADKDGQTVFSMFMMNSIQASQTFYN